MFELNGITRQFCMTIDKQLTFWSTRFTLPWSMLAGSPLLQANRNPLSTLKPNVIHHRLFPTGFRSSNFLFSPLRVFFLSSLDTISGLENLKIAASSTAFSWLVLSLSVLFDSKTKSCGSEDLVPADSRLMNFLAKIPDPAATMNCHILVMN